MSNVADRLRGMDDQFENAEAKVSGGSVPDGEYEATIDRFDFWEADRGGPLKLLTELSVATGDYAGLKPPSVWHDLEDEERLGFVKGYLHLLGLEGVKLSELETALEPVVGTRVAIRVATRTSKKNGLDYTNTYINEVLGESGSGSASVEKDDDIPF
jgi:hypothetical protein